MKSGQSPICVRHYAGRKKLDVSVAQPKTCHHWECSGKFWVAPPGHTQILRPRNLWHISSLPGKSTRKSNYVFRNSLQNCTEVTALKIRIHWEKREPKLQPYGSHLLICIWWSWRGKKKSLTIVKWNLEKLIWLWYILCVRDRTVWQYPPDRKPTKDRKSWHCVRIK